MREKPVHPLCHILSGQSSMLQQIVRPQHDSDKVQRLRLPYHLGERRKLDFPRRNFPAILSAIDNLISRFPQQPGPADVLRVAVAKIETGVISISVKLQFLSAPYSDSRIDKLIHESIVRHHKHLHFLVIKCCFGKRTILKVFGNVTDESRLHLLCLIACFFRIRCHNLIQIPSGIQNAKHIHFFLF